jgi:hypothetical protein
VHHGRRCIRDARPASKRAGAFPRQGHRSIEADLARALKNGGFIEANDPDLKKFKARGGKLLLYHGWADPGPAPENTINYYDAVSSKLGGAQDDWMRLFLLPGVGHCGGRRGARPGRLPRFRTHFGSEPTLTSHETRP